MRWAGGRGRSLGNSSPSPSLCGIPPCSSYHKSRRYSWKEKEYTMSLRVLGGRQPLAALGILTVLASLGQALALAGLMLVAGLIIPPLLILAVITLVVAGLVATGIRWAPLLGSLYSLGTLISGLVTQQYLPYHLTHPGEVGFFITALLIY